VPPGRCVALEVLTSLAGSYDDPRLQVTGVPVVVGIEGAVLERIVTPLIDNALRYARSSVVVTVLPGPVIEVGDDGPGVLPGLREAAFAPGGRLTPEDGHPGAGLGLSLVRRLARAAGGDVVLDSRPGGTGLVARVSLSGG
jgi:two-component system heavy metal sensor histidine kinase CusS